MPELTIFNVAELPKQPLVGAAPLEAAANAGGAAPDATRIIIFTSGTTGNPKGVKLSYKACASAAAFSAAAFSAAAFSAAAFSELDPKPVIRSAAFLSLPTAEPRLPLTSTGMRATALPSRTFCRHAISLPPPCLHRHLPRDLPPLRVPSSTSHCIAISPEPRGLPTGGRGPLPRRRRRQPSPPHQLHVHHRLGHAQARHSAAPRTAIHHSVRFHSLSAASPRHRSRSHHSLAAPLPQPRRSRAAPKPNRDILSSPPHNRYWSLLVRAGTGVSIGTSVTDDDLLAAVERRSKGGSTVRRSRPPTHHKPLCAHVGCSLCTPPSLHSRRVVWSPHGAGRRRASRLAPL